MDPIRRKILKTGAGAAAMAAAPQVFAQQSGQKGAGWFYEEGVRMASCASVHHFAVAKGDVVRAHGIGPFKSTG